MTACLLKWMINMYELSLFLIVAAAAVAAAAVAAAAVAAVYALLLLFVVCGWGGGFPCISSLPNMSLIPVQNYRKGGKRYVAFFPSPNIINYDIFCCKSCYELKKKKAGDPVDGMHCCMFNLDGLLLSGENRKHTLRG